MSDYTLGIIGGGNMGEALVRGVLRSGFLPSNKIIVAEPNPVRRAVFEAMGVATNEDNMAAACWPHLLLAIKPQRMLDMLAQIAPVCLPSPGTADIIEPNFPNGNGPYDRGDCLGTSVTTGSDDNRNKESE